ncbi:Aspartokinase [Furfurilactobacillus rossiae]|uniref:aspartate kinase n=1 Tax=Furfurilactobacillus rossiae TaxID=231049 RepID=UPI0015BFACC7|nr:aspartate kinase [Furfurilactobacillus rossiae]MCF6166801.1 aspartate kinase [Furfurilactobacillus rossiae]QLE65175.1 Aspartokinase [Furfurilactobacillus rossiae]
MKVIKFGGSSLADATHFNDVIQILQMDRQRRVVVVSAPGKRNENDEKVTDLLIDYARAHGKTQQSIGQQIIDRYQEIATAFDISAAQFKPLADQILALPTTSFRGPAFRMAAFKAHGEKLNAQLLALVLNTQGLAARYVDPHELGLIATQEPNNATILAQTYTHLAVARQELLAEDKLWVVPGFFAYTTSGQLATFSRGGSDITGAILARGLHATEYENFTDVDSIYAANPNVVANPAPITKMSYVEMRELSYAGFSVFHDEAIIPAIEGQVPICVKNTNHPSAPGTLIVPTNQSQPKRLITGVASSKRFAALYLHRYLLNREVGFTLKLLKILFRYHISYEHMPSGIDDLTIIFDRNQIPTDVLPRLLADIKETLQPDRLQWIDDYAILMVVGEGMRNQVGVIDRILHPLATHHIGVQMINQGASRISIMIGVREAQADDAVRLIYNDFFNQPVSLPLRQPAQEVTHG